MDTIQKEGYQLKEPWVTIIAIISVIIAFLTINGIFKNQSFMRIAEPDFSKADIQKVKKDEVTLKKEADNIFSAFKELKYVDIYSGSMDTPIGLIRACEDKKRIAEDCNKEIAKITKILTTDPTITKAYLYIKAGVLIDSYSFGNLTKNDSIYFYIDDAKQYGGHLLRSQAVWSQINNSNIELLFDLSSVPFTHLPYKDFVDPDKIPNIINVINQPEKHFIGAFVSTLGYGRIFEMRIGYKGGSIKIDQN